MTGQRDGPAGKGLWLPQAQRRRTVPPSERSLTSFAEAEAAADEFEALLHSLGLSISPGSPLEHGCLLFRGLRELHTHGAKAAEERETLAAELQEALGVQHVIKMVLKRKHHPDFASVVPHLALLSNPPKHQGEVATTKRANVRDQAANKLFELCVALAVMEEGTNLDVDHPVASANGSNPDVIATMPDGRRWGFACKVMSSEKPKTLFDRFIDGAEQIERAAVAVGVVVISMKNLLPHDAFLPACGGTGGGPMLGAIRDKDILQEFLCNEAKRRIHEMVGVVGAEAVVAQTRKFKKTLPVILVPCFVGAAFFVEDNKPVPMLYGIAYSCDLSTLSPAGLILESELGRPDLRALEAVVRGFEVA